MKNPLLAQTITRAASRQTHATIALLADRARRAQAYQAYAYFRWVDDTLDAPLNTEQERRDFIERQRELLGAFYRGDTPRLEQPEEGMLLELVKQDPQRSGGLRSYLYNLMAVMNFDATRRGRLITQAELDRYTRWLAVGVTEAMHYFIGHDSYAPHNLTRYQAVSAAHIVHMLRDTLDDVRAGYYNIPREVLEAAQISPEDVDSQAYRVWTMQRVREARDAFALGHSYLEQLGSLRCRLAGFGYAARFEGLLDLIEADRYFLRKSYPEAGAGQALLQGLAGLLNPQTASYSSPQPLARR